MVDRLPGDITPGIAAVGKSVHVSKPGIDDSSESIDLGDISGLQNVLRDFDTLIQYNEDDLVIFNGVVYRGKDTITIGVFNFSEWTQVTALPNSSCLISLPIVSDNGTQITIGECELIIVDDYTDQIRTDYFFVSFLGVIDQTLTNILTSPNTTFLVDRTGTLSQESGATPSERTLREKVIVAFASHVNNIVIDDSTVLSDVQKYNTDITIRELIRQLTGNAGALNNGISSVVNGTDTLAFNLIAGKLWGNNINRDNDRQDPNFKDVPAITPVEPIQIFRDNASGVNTILPGTGFTILSGVYDDGTAPPGALVPIGLLGNNEWTYHEVFLSVETGAVTFVWGQRVFSSESEAVLDFRVDPFPPPISTEGSILVGAWVVADNVSDLGDSNEAEFILGTGTTIGSPPLIVEDGFGSVSATVAGSINNDTVLDNRLTSIENAVHHDESIAASDEDTPLGSGVITTFRARRAFTIQSVKASLSIAPTGTVLTIDVKKNNVSIFSTLITIDVGELTSITADIPPVLSTTTVNADDKLDIDVTILDIGGTAVGLKVYFIGTTPN